MTAQDFLEIAEVIHNKSQKASNGHNDRCYIHFNLNSGYETL